LKKKEIKIWFQQNPIGNPDELYHLRVRFRVANLSSPKKARPFPPKAGYR